MAPASSPMRKTTTSEVEHALADIDADHPPRRADGERRGAGQRAGAARHVEDLPMLPDRTFASRSYERPYDLLDVTDRLPSLAGSP